METLKLPKTLKIDGEVRLPGSKSISNRVLLLAALAEGEVTLENVLDSNDVNHMVAALEKLGYDIVRDKEDRTVKLTGAGGPLPAGNFDLYLENAGTAVRSMTAAVCLGEGEYRIDGNERMRERPIAHLVDALRELGVDVTYEMADGCPPLLIKAKGLPGGRTSIDGTVSSQYLTALLISAPYAQDDLEIVIKDTLTSIPYIEMTIRLMEKFGVTVEHDNYQVFRIKAGQKYKNPERFFIEGDASTASYFLGAAALNGKVRVYGCGKDSIQGEAGFAGVMGQMGAKVTYGENYIDVESNGKLKGIDINMNTMTDTGMTLAVVAAFAEGPTAIRDIYNWRVKETERIVAVSTELRKAGAQVEEGHDYIIVTPPENGIQPVSVHTYDDHRMAMAFSLLSFGSSEVTIEDPGCCRKTFPTYFDVFASVVESE